MKNQITKSTLIPLGIALTSMLFLGGILWKTASWTTLTDSRLVAIETRLGSIDDKLGSNSLTVRYETKSEELSEANLKESFN